MPGVGAGIDEIQAHQASRLDDLCQIVTDGPKSAYEVMHEVFEDLPSSEYFLGMSEVISHLDLLRIQGRLDLRERDDGTTEYIVVEA
jgi:hypothetical protein